MSSQELDSTSAETRPAQTPRIESASDANEEPRHGKGNEDAEHGAGGLIPSAFASPRPPFGYWQQLVTAVVVGACLGLVGLGYLNLIYKVSILWLQADSNEGFPNAATLRLGTGKAWWLCVCGGGGLVVGLVKAFVFKFDTYKSFMVELQELKPDMVGNARIAFCCMLSLFCGAAVGPEAGLGALGASISLALCRGMIWCFERAVALRRDDALRAKNIDEQQGSRRTMPASEDGSLTNEVLRKLFALIGMAAAFASIFPTPIVAVVLVTELGADLPTLGVSYMHGMTLLFTGCIAAKMTYEAVLPYTWLNLPSYGLYRLLENITYSYSAGDVGVGILAGILGGLMGVFFLLFGFLTKVLSRYLKAWLDARIRQSARIVLFSTLGGFILGGIGIAAPLTLGDGSIQLPHVFADGKQIGSTSLAVSAFLKIVAYWVCTESGFVGGIFYPTLLASACLAQVFLNETSADVLVLSSCGLIAIATSFVPAPIALALVSVSSFDLSALATSPVLASVAASYLMNLGIGVPQGLAKAAARRRAAGSQES
ncbi:hypothetical protein FVE85_5280 [Porphyridium purpureum]|uniref:Uncharacterized protein n=1 Tax=Porphyridium purpureum TaxID=35688 RepID=A0A5J4Z330_PORPP|nr:hypothetical protein FVE85_5280 [Porphyridium purpureum]|eukprot:POR6082..scf295_1